MSLFQSMNLEGSTTTPRNKSLLYRLSYYSLKGWSFLNRYASQPKYALTYLSKVWLPHYREKIYFLTDEEFIKEAKTKSTIRLGDGEFTLMLGTRDIIVQKYDPALKEFFYTLASSYSKDSPFLLALPPHLNIENQELDKYDFHYLWMPGKILFRLYFDSKAIYTDASFFYRKGMTEKFLADISPQRHIIFVTNEENTNKLKIKERELVPNATAVSYVITPPANTFELREEVLKEILHILSNQNVPATVIFACGPAGKLLTYRLSLEGEVAHDVGSGISFLFDNLDHEHQMKWREFSGTFNKNRDFDKKNFNL